MSISLVVASASLEPLLPFLLHAIILAIIWAVICRFVGDGNIRWLFGILLAVVLVIDALHLFHINF